jgi:two-component system phosphate regulon response regulator OmpR
MEGKNMPETKQALIVGEDQDIAMELTSLLGGLGFDVTTLHDPAQVTQTLESRRYEVALMSRALPEMSWRNTLQTLRSASRDTTFVMITRSADEQDIRSALSAGAYVAVARPLSQEQLSHLISPKRNGLFLLLRG